MIGSLPVIADANLASAGFDVNQPLPLNCNPSRCTPRLPRVIHRNTDDVEIGLP